MRIAASNIAWDVVEDDVIAERLKHYKIDAIDIAPGKYFPNIEEATYQQIAEVRAWWSQRGISIVGMQALLFGTTGLNVFGPPEVQEKLLARLEAVARIGAGLGAQHLVFGSPKNRDKGNLNNEEAALVAVPFFQRLGDIALKAGVSFCLEPNPTCYGANFMTTNVETASVVNEVSHRAIKMQLDTGALTINGDKPEEVLAQFSSLVGHVHISERDLLVVGDADCPHTQMARSIHSYLPHHTCSIEMRATSEEPHEVSLERALKVVTHHYRSPRPIGQTAGHSS